jgi:hypothetical protein
VAFLACSVIRLETTWRLFLTLWWTSRSSVSFSRSEAACAISAALRSSISPSVPITLVGRPSSSNPTALPMDSSHFQLPSAARALNSSRCASRSPRRYSPMVRRCSS